MIIQKKRFPIISIFIFLALILLLFFFQPVKRVFTNFMQSVNPQELTAQETLQAEKLRTFATGSVVDLTSITQDNESWNQSFANTLYGNISGDGVAGYIPQFSGSNTINNSIIFQNRTDLELGTGGNIKLKDQQAITWGNGYGGTDFQIGNGVSHTLSWYTNLVKRMNLSSLGTLTLDGAHSSVSPLIIKGASGQSANLFETQNNNSFVGAAINNKGEFFNAGGVNLTGTENEIFGRFAGRALSSGGSNTLIGYQAGQSVTNGSQNMLIGSAGTQITTGQRNMGIGVGALGSLITGSFNTAVGTVALQSTTGNENVAIGDSAGQSNIAGTLNVFIGSSASGVSTGTSRAIALGRASQTITETLVAGSDSAPIFNIYFGQGINNTSPSAYTLNGVGGLGTDIRGGSIILSSGRATGNASGGDIIFRTSNTGAGNTTIQQVVTTKFIINNTGNVDVTNGSFNVSTGKDICITGGNCLSTAGNGNVSWNQSFANTLYLQNNTFNQTYHNYALNVSLNYTKIVFDTYNSTWDDPVSGGSDNVSWNQSFANTLYQVLGNYYNQSNPSGYFNISNFSSYNATYDAKVGNINVCFLNQTAVHTANVTAPYFVGKLHCSNITGTVSSLCDIQTGNISVGSGGNASWNQSFANTLYSNKTKEIFIPVSAMDPSISASSFNDHIVSVISSTGSVGFEFYVPLDFTTLHDADMIVIPDATETIQWDTQTQYGAVGEASNNSESNQVDGTTAVTFNLMTKINIKGIYAGIGAGDYVGTLFSSDTSNIRVVGFRLRYS